jgi:hypothetical protein
VAAGKAETVTDAGGSYLLRGLPAGHITLLVTCRNGESREVSLDLGPDPSFTRGHDVGFTPTTGPAEGGAKFKDLLRRRGIE